MKALIIEDMITKFMQSADIFSNKKVVYKEYDLHYFFEVGGVEITDETLVLDCAQQEFGDNLILLCGATKPLFINQTVQVISNGKNWIRLLDVVKSYYPNLEFKTNEHVYEIQLLA